MKKLKVGKYNPFTDTIKIEGTTYAAELFREFGCDFPTKIGRWMKVIKKDSGIVTIKVKEEEANDRL